MTIEKAHVDWNGGLNPFAGGDATVTYTIRNTGNAVLSAQQTAGTTGPFGWLTAKAGKIDDPPRLLPGESWEVSVPVRGVPASFWLAATASVTPVVVDASGSITTLAPVVATATGWAVPWMLLVLLLLLAAAIVGAWQLVKRTRARQRAREDARVKEAIETALGKVSAETGLISEG